MDLPARRTEITVYRYQKERARTAATTPASAARTLLLLAAAVLFVVTGWAAAPVQAHPSSFSDVPDSGSVHQAVEYMAAAGMLSGYPDGTFGPNKQLNRGQAAKILVSQQGIKPVDPLAHVFSDVEAVYGSYVEAAANEGWIGGYADGTFRTYEPLQRQHMAVIMVRSLGWEQDAESISESQVTDKLDRFGDLAEISGSARPYVALAVERGLFQGNKDGYFNPTAGLSRNQFALVVYRAELRDRTLVQGIRFSDSHEDKTRVVLDLSGDPGDPKVAMSGSSVLTVELSKAVLEDGPLDVQVGSGEVEASAVRQVSYRPQRVRVTVTLKRFSRYEVRTVKPSDGRGYRLVIDIFKRSNGPEGNGPPLVALDAGHGGDDSGAVGITGVKEKTINLAIVKIVDAALREAGMRTMLTRSDDTFVPLKERSGLANQAGASIFVSVHNNASGDPSSNGTETFYWAADGEEDRPTEGRRLAETIQKNLVYALDCNDRRARTHWLKLHVLWKTVMPAALTEVGFLTNKEEEGKLKDPNYQQKAGEAIARGILEFMGWVPPLQLPDNTTTTDTTTTDTTTTDTTTPQVPEVKTS